MISVPCVDTSEAAAVDLMYAPRVRPTCSTDVLKMFDRRWKKNLLGAPLDPTTSWILTTVLNKSSRNRTSVRFLACGRGKTLAALKAVHSIPVE